MLASMIYAVVQIGSQQEKVTQGSEFSVQRLPQEAGSDVTLDQILLVAGDGLIRIGQPHLAGARLVCLIVRHERGPKVIAYRFRRRKGYHRKVGHRQWYTRLQVKAIQV